jgi:ketosteroid isomerase-like protein
MLFAVGCETDTSSSRAGEASTTSSENRDASGTNEASGVVRRHIAAINRGDVDAYLVEVGLDATFDIGGRTFEGTDEIRSFVEGEVAGGRYEIIDERTVEGPRI